MSQTVADRIQSLRNRQFVGRDDETSAFRELLADVNRECLVLNVFGPGGVGKTTLLRHWVSLSKEAGKESVVLDGRNLQPTPEAFIGSLCLATQAPGPAEALQALDRKVLFIDTFEAIEPLEGWLRETFLPQLPAATLVAIFGRRRPGAAWRQDAWTTLGRIVPLRNLEDHESRRFLADRSVPSKAIDGILRFTHGHPLALSLVAETFAQSGLVPTAAAPPRDVVGLLLERFLEGVQEPLHRDLLEVCALVRLTTEALIAEVVDAANASELFEWLRSLSFIESTPLGLMPHDLARDAISADLRWRNPDRYSELHHKARAYYSDRLERSSGLAQRLILFDYIYLHRDNPMVGSFFQWHSHPAAYMDRAVPSDREEVLRIVATHEGPQAAELAGYWFDQQPQGFWVARDSHDTRLCQGLLCMVELADVDRTTCPDPAVTAALSYLEGAAPMRKGERGTYFRSWMADKSYQEIGPIQSLLFISIVQHYLTTPGLAVIFLSFRDADFWAPMFQYALHSRVAQADFEVGGHKYGGYFVDWRILPPKVWLERLSEQEVPIKEASGAPRAAPDMVVLSQTSFADAVSEAMKSFTNAAKLGQSPLLRSRVVVDSLESESDTKARIHALRQLLHGAAKTLTQNPKDAKLFQALETGYFRPERSQEVAAEKVDVSIATYRRHLKAGVERVNNLLWQQETKL